MNWKMLIAIFFVVLIASLIANIATKQTLLDANGNATGTIKRGIGFGAKFPVKK